MAGKFGIVFFRVEFWFRDFLGLNSCDSSDDRKYVCDSQATVLNAY